MEKKSFRIVRKTIVSAPESLMTLCAGETASVSCGEFASLSTIQSAACRLNQDSGFKEFEVSSPDNGATIIMHRNVKGESATDMQAM